jgi:hypothetical protein
VDRIEFPEAIAGLVPLDRLRAVTAASTAVRDMVIPHFRFTEVISHLTKQHLRWRPGADVEAKCLLLYGKTRVGKTVPLRWYADQFPAYRDEKGMVRRVLYVVAPSGADKHSLQRRILRKLGIEVSLPSDVATAVIDYQLRMQRVELVIIGEFNHLADLKSTEKQYLAADMLKEFANWNSCQLAFSGLDSSLNVLEANGQLLNRSPYREEVKRYDWHATGERVEFINFLAELATALPFRRKLALDDVKVAQRFACASGGLVGLAVEFVAVGAEIAVEQGTTDFKLQHLADAFDVLKPAGLPGNPFRSAVTNVMFDTSYADLVTRGLDQRIELWKRRKAS